MRLRDYLWDHIGSILLYLSAYGSTLFFLYLFHVNTSILIGIAILVLLLGGMILCYEYSRRSRFYRQLLQSLDQLDQKYLIHELCPSASFLEGNLLRQILYESGKSMNEHIGVYRDHLEDFKDYIELWVHEVKLPIAAGELILHNHPNASSAKLREQFDRLENDVEQVLYYARSENTEKDYLIKRCSLDGLVQNVIRRNKDSLLYRQIAIDFAESGAVVFTDSKWLEFIINQILSNSIKYCPAKQGKITIRIEEDERQVVLNIRDNGVGIAQSEVGRVFEKSFTGQNGRTTRTSTGMGLYLCHKLCERLGHGITLESREGSYTSVSLSFIKNEYYKVVRG